MSPKVVLNRAAFSYGSGFSVEVSMTAEPDRVTCLLGVSGSGKTSLLKLVAGLLEPKRGEVLLGGKNANGLSPGDRNVCIVFQTPSLLPYKTVVGNVIFAMRGGDPSFNIVSAMDFLRNVGLDGYADRYPNELSMGQQQRVALARAFASGCEIMLLDEPFSNLDVESGAQAREYLASLIKQYARTVILVTHSAAEAMLLGDYVYVINDGKVAQSGTPRELYHNPCDIFVARFFGPLNIIHANTDGYGNVMLPFAACFRVKMRDSLVILGIRHESIIVASPGDTECAVAVVLSVRFFGAYDLVRLMFCGGDILDMRCEAGDPGICIGCPVRVRFDWSAVIALQHGS